MAESLAAMVARSREAYPLTELEQGMKAFLSGEVLKNLIVPVEGLGVRG